MSKTTYTFPAKGDMLSIMNDTKEKRRFLMKKLFAAVIIGLVFWGCATAPREPIKASVGETINDGVIGYEIYERSSGAQRTDYFFIDLTDAIRSYWSQKLSPNGVEIADADNNTGFYYGMVGGYCWRGDLDLEQVSGEIDQWTLVYVDYTDPDDPDYGWSFYYFTETVNRDDMPPSAYRVIR